MKRKGSGKHKQKWGTSSRRSLKARIGHAAASRHRDDFLKNPKNVAKTLKEYAEGEEE